MTNKDKSIKLKIYENDNIIYSKNKLIRFSSASDVLENTNLEKFSTGSSQLDEILGGGIETGSITQFYGAPGSGKSQICLTACALLPQKYNSIYIDTEHKLRPERIAQILEKRGLESSKVLNNIIIAKPINTQEMERAIDKICTFFDSNKSLKLVVVDSIINLLRVEYQGKSQLPLRQQKLNLFMSKLQNISTEKKVAVIITNHIQTNPSSFSSFYNEIPTGGNIIKYCSTHIVRLKKNIEDTCTLFDKK